MKLYRDTVNDPTYLEIYYNMSKRIGIWFAVDGDWHENDNGPYCAGYWL